MQQASSPVLQQLRSLHSASPYAIHHHHSQDGALYPPAHHVPELQNLHATNVYHQPQPPYGLNATPQPQSHVLPVHYEPHGLPPASFPTYPANYQQSTSPRFLSAQPASVPVATPQYHHASPQSIPRPLPQQHAPIPPPSSTPVLRAPQHVVQRVEHVPPSFQSPPQPAAGNR